MAEGVEGSVVFIPFLTSKYMASPNCRRECTAATEMKKTVIPIMCEKFEASGWLRACITGLLWYPSFDHTMAQDTLQSFLASLDESLPKDSPARKPNLAIYISYSLKNKKEAEILKRKLEDEKPPFTCIMSADEKLSKTKVNEVLGKGSGSSSSFAGTPSGSPRGVSENRREGNLKKSALLEEKLKTAKAVIVLLSSDSETSDHCKNDVSLCYSYRKVIIPILVKTLRNGYPPKDMEFALRSVNCLDFINLINNPQKHITMMRRLFDALSGGTASASPAISVSIGKDFRIKTAGNWTKQDVEHWLIHVGLPQYVKEFQKRNINGRVLLSLTDKDLDSLSVMKIHQRKFFVAISDLFTALSWNEDEVAEWLDRIGQQGVAQSLYEAHINGQSLLMLTDTDLLAANIADPVIRKSILLEIQYLKETCARVPQHDDIYRFTILRNVIRPIPSDSTGPYKFSQEVMDLLKSIYNSCDPEKKGLNQVGFKKFLLVLLVTIGAYLLPNELKKDFWIDLNTPELLCMKKFASEFEQVMDEIVTDIDDFLHTTEENEMEPQLRHPRYTNIMCLCYVILNNIQHAR